MTNKWDYLISISESHGTSVFIGEYVMVKQTHTEEIADLYKISEMDVINSGRETPEQYDDGYFVLAKCDFPEEWP